MVEVKVERRVALLTADRFSPWNGTRLTEPDHIWADLPIYLGLPLLVFQEDGTSRSHVDYLFGDVMYTTEGRPKRWRIALLVLQSLALALRNGPRLLLGVRPILFVSRAKRAFLGQPSPGDLTRWHRVVLQLSQHLRKNPVDVLVFHGEFDAWGTAVVWACRRTGTHAIAHQHYAMPANTPHYRRVGRLGRFAPDGLMCVSKHQRQMWSRLPLAVGFGGSRRPIWNLSGWSDTAQHRIAQLLLVPSVGDTDQIQQTIRTRTTEQFHVRPHPARMSGWDLPNVVLQEENLVDLLGRFDVVVTSSPSPTVTLTAAKKPFIKMRGGQPDGTCDCGERKTFAGLGDLLDALDEGIGLSELTSLGCEHNDTCPPSREEYLNDIFQSLAHS